MTIVDRIRALSNQRDMSLPQLEVELGLGNGTISRWRTSSPNTDKLRKIADYFNVSIDYLLGREAELNKRDERDISKDLETIRKKLASKEDGPISFDGENIPDADIDMFLGQIEIMLRRLKPINKEKYNPNKNKV